MKTIHTESMALRKLHYIIAVGDCGAYYIDGGIVYKKYNMKVLPLCTPISIKHVRVRVHNTRGPY